ncbi:patatin-like phospholipase family protein [Paenibacillus illinoisensis]|uniref:patatin-like phospholipase family protein n=1 Tax=Paenibacillus illinoisensis TaxID=59845 RepID=UPI003015F251
MKLGIALGGGGVRSAAQLGVVQALLEDGIVPEIYAGTSGGSIAASLLALGYEPIKAFEKFKVTRNVLDIAFVHIIAGMTSKEKMIQGLFKGKRLEKSLNQIFDGKRIGEIEKPLGIATTNLIDGSQLIFTNETQYDWSKIEYAYTEWNSWGDLNLSEIVRASCSLPAVFLPKQLDYRTLVDGGLTNNLPSDIAFAMGADRVVTIALSSYESNYKLEGIPSILRQTVDIVTKRNVDIDARYHDMTLRLPLDDVNILDFERLEECFTRGYVAGKEKLPLIRESLSNLAI